MEQQLLRQMVEDRETQIRRLVSSIDDTILRISKTKIQLTRVKHQSRSQEQVFDDQVALLQERQASMEQDWTKLQGELKHVGSLRIYRQAMLRDTNESNDDVDVHALRSQCQLCKALHYIHVLQNEMMLYKKTSDAEIVILKRFVTSMMESKSKVEMDAMNLILKVDAGKRQMVESYSQLLKESSRNVAEWQEMSDTSIHHDDDNMQTIEKEVEDEESPYEDSDDDQDEYDLMDAEERRKIFEKRKNELMGAHLGLRSSSRQILVE